jgi:hypothetical protein
MYMYKAHKEREVIINKRVREKGKRGREKGKEPSMPRIFGARWRDLSSSGGRGGGVAGFGQPVRAQVESFF